MSSRLLRAHARRSAATPLSDQLAFLQQFQLPQLSLYRQKLLPSSLDTLSPTPPPEVPSHWDAILSRCGPSRSFLSCRPDSVSRTLSSASSNDSPVCFARALAWRARTSTAMSDTRWFLCINFPFPYDRFPYGPVTNRDSKNIRASEAPPVKSRRSLARATNPDRVTTPVPAAS
jgi:hypothetical protein